MLHPLEDIWVNVSFISCLLADSFGLKWMQRFGTFAKFVQYVSPTRCPHRYRLGYFSYFCHLWSYLTQLQCTWSPIYLNQKGLMQFSLWWTISPNWSRLCLVRLHHQQWTLLSRSSNLSSKNLGCLQRLLVIVIVDSYPGFGSLLCGYCSVL